MAESARPVTDQREAAPQSELIAARYQVVATLGRGGMAVVEHVLDLQTGEHVALKRMHKSGDAAAQALFEREYQTLAQLVHPRIIRVLDYGVNAGAPYYTMELLEGRELRAEARARRPSWQTVCGWLRDVASALALLHSRRLVHRDVSPRNVWITASGSAKLIDFGALTVMGTADHVVGTPPCVAPEALMQQPLDGRTDLYAVGALAYFLLTMRHAYPVPALADLRNAWQRRPRRPIALVPELPPALSELVMTLLSLDPRARPKSAAEVVEQLGSIAQLPADDCDQAAQAFLTTPVLVGREAETRAVRKRLLRAAGGRGGAYVVIGKAGAGRSRMLASFALEAKLIGASVAAVRVKSSDLHGGLLQAMAEALLRSSSEAVPQCRDLAPILACLSPAISAALGAPTPYPDVAVGRHTSAAFVEWVTRIAQRNCLLISVDDVDHADALSHATLAQLASLSRTMPLVVACSAQQHAADSADPSLRQLLANSLALPLAPLTFAHTEALLQSVFGDVPHLDDAVTWLYELSEGNPGTCMEFVQHVVEQRIVRYSAGQWILPERLRDFPLPANLDALLDMRVGALSADARLLGLGLALTRDDTRPGWQPQTHVHTRDFGKILAVDDSLRTGAAVAELVRAGLLRESDGQYTFAQRAMGDALRRSASEPQCQLMHARIADLLLEDGYNERDLANLHLLRAGQGDRAVEQILAGFAESDGRVDWSKVRISVAMAALTRALEHVESHDHAPLAAIMIRRTILLASMVNDWSLARYGSDQLRRLREDAGVSEWDQIDASFPVAQRLSACLARARERYDATPEARRGLAPLDAMRELASCIMTLSASYARAFDMDKLAELPPQLALLRVLSPSIDALARVNELTVARAQGRDTSLSSAQVLAALAQASDLPDLVRVGAIMVITHLQAVDFARMGNKDAVTFATRIDQFRPGAWMADHARWLSSGFDGDAAATARYRKRAETVVEDDAWRRSASLFVEAQMHVITGNKLDLKRVVELLVALASKFPGWSPIAHWAQGELHRMDGDLAAAKVELERGLALAQPGRHLAWTLLSPSYAVNLLERDQLDALRVHALDAIRIARSEGLTPTVIIDCERALALGESRAGQHEVASVVLDRAFAAAQSAGVEGLPLASLYEARARIARAAQDPSGFAQALASLHALVDAGGMPGWLARCVALIAEESDAAPGPVQEPEFATDSAADRLSVNLSQCSSKSQVAERALQALLTEVSAVEGYLYCVDADEPVLAATASSRSSPGVARGGPGDEIDTFARRFTEDHTMREVTVAQAYMDLESLPPPPRTASIGGRRYLPVVLTDADDDRARVLGVAVLQVDDEHTPDPDLGVVRVISRALKAAGDRPSLVS